MPRLSAGTRPAYRVKVGINYGPTNIRREPGDIVDDLPAHDALWLLEHGCIEPVEPVAANVATTPDPQEGGE